MDLSLNRSFKYGDGLFETLRVIDNKVVFLKEHFERLENGFQILGFDKPSGFSAKWFENQILNYLVENINNANLQNWRVRISFWRNSTGFYCPENNTVAWSIETTPLADSNYVLNAQGFEIGIYNDVKISADILSSVKSCSGLPYVMAAIYKKKMGWDEAIILNSKDRIAELSSSNIFILKSKQLFTPSLDEAALPGVCRRLIIETAENIGLNVLECPLYTADLEAADEIWLTNAISGIRWVNKLQWTNQKFGSNKAALMIEELNKKAKSWV
jgi:branched-chain amino acid aminotransferase